MPHIIIKLYPGRSEDQKAELTEKIVEQVVRIAKCEEKVVSVAFEEVEPKEWDEKVYKPDIQNKQNQLYRKPGYGPLSEI
ncbi:tautomerase family protein [Desulfopila inferna]|uniref:tautomerase family protein n=1 Tax=Desulfopila inferna TaxID=468528 RepID=UPI0019655728|nr:tautomerase family protein [Desulfopila inferna]MBM9606248.1 tautomerase family protein [Desulfopila inferna]